MVELRGAQLDLVFAALADGTRRAMLRRLSAGELSVGELAEPLNMSLAAASKHIKALERAGLIHRHIEGRTHRCALNAKPLAGARDWLAHYETFWNERLDALERALLAPTPALRAARARKPRK